MVGSMTLSIADDFLMARDAVCGCACSDVLLAVKWLAHCWRCAMASVMCSSLEKSCIFQWNYAQNSTFRYYSDMYANDIKVLPITQTIHISVWYLVPSRFVVMDIGGTTRTCTVRTHGTLPCWWLLLIIMTWWVEPCSWHEIWDQFLNYLWLLSEKLISQKNLPKENQIPYRFYVGMVEEVGKAKRKPITNLFANIDWSRSYLSLREEKRDFFRRCRHY